MHSSEVAAREHVLGEIRALADEGRLTEALKLIGANGAKDAALVNAAGVCHLRSGNPARAVEVLRDLCVGEGLGVRPGAPPPHVANFATALLLTGNLPGYRHTMRHLDGSTHPAAVRLRAAVTDWERSLGKWRRLGLKLGVWEPKRPIDLGYPPGAFE